MLLSTRLIILAAGIAAFGVWAWFMYRKDCAWDRDVDKFLESRIANRQCGLRFEKPKSRRALPAGWRVIRGGKSWES